MWRRQAPPEELPPCDVLVIGAGPTGLMLAYCLSQWGHRVRVVDNRPESLKAGRADGIQPRTLDMFINLNLIDHFNSKEPGFFDTVAFWDPRRDGGGGIEQTSKTPTCPPHIHARHPRTTTLHQGLIEDMFLNFIREAGGVVQRPWTIDSFKVDNRDPTYPVRTVISDLETKGRRAVVRSKYLFGAQGGRSTIRDMLGIGMVYYTKTLQPTAWAVIDAEVDTDFPGIKWKNNIHSEAGSMMIIPRENKLVRFYIQSHRPLNEEVPLHEAKQLVVDILRPYRLAFKYIDWTTTYKVGQGRAKAYGSRDLRVFLGGDTCHTHSPKAGQGMNTGILDAANLAWKINAVERGFARRALLQTYEAERLKIATNLLDFDAKYTKLFSAKSAVGADGHNATQDDFFRTAQENALFTSGHGSKYLPNMLNAARASAPPALARMLVEPGSGTALDSGFILPSADVTRLRDTALVHLEQVFPMNGAFRLYLFAGHHPDVTALAALRDFAAHATRPGGVFAGRRTSSGGSRGLRAATFLETCVVWATVAPGATVDELVPPGLTIAPDNVYTDEPTAATAQRQWTAYGEAGLRPDKPVVAIVRPDSYVGAVVRLAPGPETAGAVAAYFDGLMTKHAAVEEQARL